MEKRLIQNYRGVRNILVVSILEGDGKDRPYEIVEYALYPETSGKYRSYGKVIPLTPEEKSWFN